MTLWSDGKLAPMYVSAFGGCRVRYRNKYFCQWVLSAVGASAGRVCWRDSSVLTCCVLVVSMLRVWITHVLLYDTMLMTTQVASCVLRSTAV